MRGRRLVAVVATVLAVLAVAGAAGCQNRFGAAVVVGDYRVSASEVDTYVDDVTAAGGGTYSRDVLRASIVTTIVRNRLMELLAARLGLHIDPAALAAATGDPANVASARSNGLPVALLAEANLVFGAISHHLDPRFDVNGLRVFDPVTSAEMNTRITDRIRPVLAANPVNVNPAYGAFSPHNLAVYPPGAAAPATEPWIRPATTAPAS
ncbi:hypothetical protein [Fodinicola acaciae]|uniref:hypothetical protein n=1 Tax=Fodinicola acaciae TaxID=2681555 RepID=UPI0013CFD596|nr:hypothetical protein [Fodinicola acaciae]